MAWQQLQHALRDHFGTGFTLREREPVSGGCINDCWRLDTSEGRFFLKLNRADCAGLFTAEWRGLTALRRSGALRVPQPMACGVNDGASWLLLEHIEFGADTPVSARRLGEGLAQLHHNSAAEFGFDGDNYLGATEQINARAQNWGSFFRDRRLGHQLALAREHGAPHRLLASVAAVMSGTEAILGDHHPIPCLLHGDLWAGNWGTDNNGSPVLYDPAVYYGDRETDLAMTALFGGFPKDFYDAYHTSYPPLPGQDQRRTLYNLYHILNHFNLFGGGYGAQAQRMCESLLDLA